MVKVVRQGNFLGVVAESEWGAIKAAREAQGIMVEIADATGRMPSCGMRCARARSSRTR